MTKKKNSRDRSDSADESNFLKNLISALEKPKMKKMILAIIEEKSVKEVKTLENKADEYEKSMKELNEKIMEQDKQIKEYTKKINDLKLPMAPTQNVDSYRDIERRRSIVLIGIPELPNGTERERYEWDMQCIGKVIRHLDLPGNPGINVIDLHIFCAFVYPFFYLSSFSKHFRRNLGFRRASFIVVSFLTIQMTVSTVLLKLASEGHGLSGNQLENVKFKIYFIFGHSYFGMSIIKDLWQIWAVRYQDVPGVPVFKFIPPNNGAGNIGVFKPMD